MAERPWKRLQARTPFGSFRLRLPMGGNMFDRRRFLTVLGGALLAGSRPGFAAGSAASRLTELGISLPTAAAPIANYVPFVRTGSLLVVSGQLSAGLQGVLTGKLGGGVSIEDGQKAARQAAINVLAQIQAATGDLDKVTRVVRLGGFINCTPDFADAAKVMNGASDLMVQVFGDKGRHSRSTIGVAALPANAVVEVEALVEVA